MADCFIIMPISTPESLATVYAGDKDHFKHVLECLFVPAVERAGLKPIPPIAKGADVIHAEVVQNLERAELVLCDMSSLNANVFFELGIRTAIGKPVCMLIDDATIRVTKVPFDTGIVNYRTYASRLFPWNLESETTALVDHINESKKRSAGQNLLWKYFGLSQQAVPAKSSDVTSDRLAFISAQVEALSSKMDTLNQPDDPLRTYFARELSSQQIDELRLRHLGDLRRKQLYENLAKYAAGKEFNIIGVSASGGNQIQVHIDGKKKPGPVNFQEMTKIAGQLGFDVTFVT